jgi:hypothetical protein
LITHIVFFKLKEPASSNIAELQKLLISMTGKIPMLRHIEVGIDQIRSERSYDVALLTRFDSLEDLNSYQLHPFHANEVLPYVKSACSSVVAVDYST